WSPIGSGFNSFVNSLAVYNGELIAGGWFSIAGVRSIARWDGSDWTPLGGGVGLSDCPSCGADVSAMLVYNGELIAAGYFTVAGSTLANHIARWNGTNWSNLQGGVNNQVFALAELDGALYAGGVFNRANGSIVV